MHQGTVVQKVDNVIQRINLYPLDSAIGFPKTYPLDSDFRTTRARGVLFWGEGLVDPPSLGNLGAKFSHSLILRPILRKLAEVIFRQQLFKTFGSNNFTLSLMFSFQNARPI